MNQPISSLADACAAPQAPFIPARLAERSSRSPDYAAESQALLALAEAVPAGPNAILQTLAEAARVLCAAPFAAVCLRAGRDGPLEWAAQAGCLAGVELDAVLSAEGGVCHDVLREGASRLLPLTGDRQEEGGPPGSPREALLLPLLDCSPPGVLCVLSGTERAFDREDARLLESSSRAASAGCRAHSPRLSARQRGQTEQRGRTEMPLDDSKLRARDRERASRTEPFAEVARDIAEREQAQEHVRLGEKRSGRLADVLPVAVYTCDAPSGTISYYNEEAARLWGRAPTLGDTAERFCGSHKLFLPDGTYVPHENCPMAVALRDGTEFHDEEVVIKRADGSSITALVNICPIRDPSGHVVGAVNAFLDVSALKAAEQALRNADRHKNEFLALLGHELRNPLAPLRTGLELLASARAKPELLEGVRAMMCRQLSHLVRLVDDLLDVARINSGRLELKRAPLDLKEVVEAAVEANEPSIAEHGHELTVCVRAPLPLDGDADRLTQVLSNLLSNATKYMDDGGTIELTAERQNDEAVVRVRDTGFGIPNDRLETLFKMFNRLSEHQSDTPAGGLGVGLALSRKLVELHGGQIDGYSKGPGHGSEFVVRLPIACADAMHVPDERRAPIRVDASSAPSAPIAPIAPIARSVLIVDDNVDAAEALRMILEVDGHTVHIVHDGEVALAATPRQRPEVVLLDIGLPLMDGYEVARRLRTLDAGRETLLCAVTGWGGLEDKRRAAEAGFDHHLVKPVTRDALRRVLEKVPTRVVVPAALDA